MYIVLLSRCYLFCSCFFFNGFLLNNLDCALRRKWEMTRKAYLNKQATFRMCSESRTPSSQNRNRAWQAGQDLRSSFYSQRNWVIKRPESESQGQALSSWRRSNIEVFLLWTKWACSRARKDKWGKSRGHLPSAFQLESGNTVQRAFQLCRCRQGWHFWMHKESD